MFRHVLTIGIGARTWVAATKLVTDLAQRHTLEGFTITQGTGGDGLGSLERVLIVTWDSYRADSGFAGAAAATFERSVRHESWSAGWEVVWPA